jgi:hypothetical protein
MTRFFSPLTQRRTYMETADLLIDLVVGVAFFSVFTTLIATGASLLITLVGLPILTATFYLVRASAALERWRTRVFLGATVEPPVRVPAAGDGVLQKLVTPFRDQTTWKELAYVWLIQPVQGIVNFTVAVTAWAVPLYALTLPIYFKLASPELWNGHELDAWSEVLPIALAGLVLLPLVPWVIRALAAVDRAAARWFLHGIQPAHRPAEIVLV